MNKFINKFALLISVLTFVLCISSGITIVTSIARTAIVFLGVHFTFFIAGHLLQWGIIMMTQKPEIKNK